MKLYFVFSVPIVGPITEPSGGFGDLVTVARDREAAEQACRDEIEPTEMGNRSEAWFTEFDTDTLAAGDTVYITTPTEQRRTFYVKWRDGSRSLSIRDVTEAVAVVRAAHPTAVIVDTLGNLPTALAFTDHETADRFESGLADMGSAVASIWLELSPA